MNILAEAHRLVTGDRNNSYGPPAEDYQRVAAIYRSITGKDFTATDAALVMVCVKLGRLGYGLDHGQDVHDTLIDLAGYAHVVHECWQAKDESR